ncbi:MAG: hypothetical protein LBQ60_00830 [Bacteroidales bacterium]|jgi:hypothetical protein|nr:hypothetical protein [Bacteroidales bacterium]
MKFKILAGVITAVFVLVMNLQHALSEYGILKNNLHGQVQAQSTSRGNGGTGSGNGTGSSEDDEKKYDIHTTPISSECTVYVGGAEAKRKVPTCPSVSTVVNCPVCIL